MEKSNMVELPPISPQCKFRPDTFRSKILWLLLGTVLGFVLSYGLSSYQDQQRKLNETHQWIDATAHEIDYNTRWQTNSPIFVAQGDSIPIKRHVSYSALQSFLDLLPKLTIGDTLLADSGRTLLTLILSTNQLIDNRNFIRNRIITGSKGSLDSLVAFNNQLLQVTEQGLDKALDLVVQRGRAFSERLERAQARL